MYIIYFVSNAYMSVRVYIFIYLICSTLCILQSMSTYTYKQANSRLVWLLCLMQKEPEGRRPA